MTKLIHKLSTKLGFADNKKFIGFLVVVTSGQLIYSAFEAFKGTFYNLLLDVLHLSNAQMGTLFSLIGLSMFMYIPGGWLNNRFSTKSLLISGLLIRFITIIYIVLFSPGFDQLRIVAFVWGVVDAFFWPAVLNGVILMTSDKNRATGFGLLESIRRAEEVVMNFLIVAAMSILGGIALFHGGESIFKAGMLFYNFLLIPLVFLIIKYVPKNGISTEKESKENKSVDALKGVFYVLLKPQVWLAALAGMAVYWIYIILIYTVPYLQATFGLTAAQAAIFGILNTGIMGVIGGIVAGFLADKVFKSSSLLMSVALMLSAIFLAITLVLPNDKAFLFVSIIILFLFSFSIFLAKSIILAPVAEVKIPEKYSGSSMSIGSFLAYAPVFWAYSMNGSIIDKYLSNPAEAYKIIFTIGIVVSLLGSACAFILVLTNKRKKTKENK